MLTPAKWTAMPFVAFAVASVLTNLLGQATVLVLAAATILGAAWFLGESLHPLPALVLLTAGAAAGVLMGMTRWTWYSIIIGTLILSGQEVIRWIGIPYALFGLAGFGFAVGALFPGALGTVATAVLGSLGIALGIAAGWYFVYGDSEPIFERGRTVRDWIVERYHTFAERRRDADVTPAGE